MNPKPDDVLLTHWFDPDDLDDDHFTRSFIRRGEALLGMIGNAMGQDLGSGRTVFEEHLDIFINLDGHVAPYIPLEERED